MTADCEEAFQLILTRIVALIYLFSYCLYFAEANLPEYCKTKNIPPHCTTC